MKETFSKPRRQTRLELALPVRVRVRESHDYEWTEITQLINVNQMGARFALARPVETGRVAQLTLALPSQLRSFAVDEPLYRVFALVTNVEFINTQPTGPVCVGVAFLGLRPPPGWEDNPARLYEIVAAPTGRELWRAQELPDGAVKDALARPETRHPIAAEVELQLFGARPGETASERTVTENLSPKGAAVFTTLNLAEGRFARVVSASPDVSLVAAVRSRRQGADGRARLHLEFISGEWPLEGVEKVEDED